MMVPVLLQTVSLVGILLYFSVIIYLLKKKVLTLNYTLLWIFSGALMAMIVIYPTILINISELVGISTPSNALFAVIFFFVLLILMSVTSIISSLNDKNQRLIQSMGILEKRVREIENKH